MVLMAERMESMPAPSLRRLTKAQPPPIPLSQSCPPDFPHSTVINLNRMQNPQTIHVQSRKIHKRRGVCLHPISMNEDTPLAVIQ